MIPKAKINFLFIDFDDLDESLYRITDKTAITMKRVTNDYKVRLSQWKMKSEVFQWCKDNHIKYRKVTIGNSVFNEKRRVIDYIGERHDGILFYSPEDATAFKLRWL